MNFKDWKKIEEDGKTIKLQHPSGHVMLIAIKALPKVHQEQIKRLEFAKGGDVLDSGEGGESSQGKDVRHANKQKKRGEPAYKETMQGAKEEAKGRALAERQMVKPKIKGLAHGGTVKYEKADLAKQGTEKLKAKHTMSPESKAKNNKFWKEADQELKTIGHSGPMRKEYADGTENEPVSKDDSAPMESAPPPQAPTTTINIVPGAGPGPTPQVAPMPMSPAPTGMTAPVSSAFRKPVTTNPPVPVGAAAPAPSVMNSDETLNAPKAVQQQQEALGEKAQIEKAQFEAAAKNTANNLQNQQMIANQQAQNINEMKAATDAFANYSKENPINPKAYQESMSTKQKVATGIGLFFGGFGSAFGGHNYAMDFLNKQIDRDIDSQKARADQQKTVYGFYHNLYGDENIATNLAKVSANDMLVREAELQAAQNGTAIAAQKLKELRAQKAIENNQLLIDSAGRRGTLSTGGGRNLQNPNQPSAPSEGATKPNHGNGNTVYKILAPDADRKIMGVKYGPMKGSEEKVQQQYQQAIQAEKLLNGPNNDGVGGVSDLLKQMHDSAKQSGIYGHLHRTAGEALESLPVIGQAAGAASSSLPATESENKYNNAQIQIETDMATALKDLMTPTEIHKLVHKVSPTLTDSPAAVKNKEKTLVNSISKAVRGGLLQQANMLRKEK